MIEDENDDDGQEIEDPNESALAVATCHTAIARLQDFHLNPVPLPAHQVAQLETIDDQSEILEIEEVPEKVKADPEFRKFFTAGAITLTDPYNPKKKIRLEDRLLEYPSRQLPAEYAESGIIRLCQRHGIAPADTADMVRFWHQLRIQADRYDSFTSSHPDEEYNPGSDTILDGEIEVGTPTREEIAAKIEAILRESAPAEVATTLVFVPQRDRLGALTKLRQVLGVNIARWFQLGFDKPEFAMALQDERVITIGSAAAVLSQTTFRQKLYAGAGRAFPKLSEQAWLDVCNSLASIVEAGDDFNGEKRANVFNSIHEYMLTRMEESRSRAIIAGRPFRDGGRLYLRAEDLPGDKEEVIEQLKAAGFQRASITARIPNGSSRTTKSYWHADESRPDIKKLVDRIMSPQSSPSLCGD